MHVYFRIMRLHQPIGIWLLLWPCLWSVTLASDGMPSPLLLALFAVGAVVMRSAGCIINDIADRRIDREVERTRNRPLASGELLLSHALMLLLALLLIALAIAAVMGRNVVLYAALSLPLVTTYPLMKRITWWPQLFLGLTFNWGALLGWVSVRGVVELPALLLYAACIFWTLSYDTIYAHQDKVDDERIGVKSTARWMGSRSLYWLIAFNIMLILLLTATGIAIHAGIPYYATLFLIAAHSAWQLCRVNIDSPVSCQHIFRSNYHMGMIFFAGLLVDKF